MYMLRWCKLLSITGKYSTIHRYIDYKVVNKIKSLWMHSFIYVYGDIDLKEYLDVDVLT